MGAGAILSRGAAQQKRLVVGIRANGHAADDVAVGPGVDRVPAAYLNARVAFVDGVVEATDPVAYHPGALADVEDRDPDPGEGVRGVRMGLERRDPVGAKTVDCVVLDDDVAPAHEDDTRTVGIANDVSGDRNAKSADGFTELDGRRDMGPVTLPDIHNDVIGDSRPTSLRRGLFNRDGAAERVGDDVVGNQAAHRCPFDRQPAGAIDDVVGRDHIGMASRERIDGLVRGIGDAIVHDVVIAIDVGSGRIAVRVPRGGPAYDLVTGVVSTTVEPEGDEAGVLDADVGKPRSADDRRRHRAGAAELIGPRGSKIWI